MSQQMINFLFAECFLCIGLIFLSMDLDEKYSKFSLWLKNFALSSLLIASSLMMIFVFL